MAAGYSSGLKWNEEDKLKADMMNRPERWVPITVKQVRAKCRELGMRPNDVDTVAGFLQRRKDGRRFNVRSSYRDFQFNRWRLVAAECVREHAHHARQGSARLDGGATARAEGQRIA